MSESQWRWKERRPERKRGGGGGGERVMVISRKEKQRWNEEGEQIRQLGDKRGSWKGDIEIRQIFRKIKRWCSMQHWEQRQMSRRVRERGKKRWIRVKSERGT